MITGRHLLAALERLRDVNPAALDLPLSVHDRNVTHLIVRFAWLMHEPRKRSCIELLCCEDDPFGRFGLHDLPDLAGELGHYARGEAMVGRDLKPWHDTPVHACDDGTRGPVSPQLDRPVANPAYPPNALRCCACGDRWLESDPLIVAHAWWSLGAYEGKEAAEERVHG